MHKCIYRYVMANIMKKTIQIIIVMILLYSCGQQAREKKQDSESADKNQTESIQSDTNVGQNIEKKVGEELFNSILDTINIEMITNDFLTKNNWIFRPFEDCESYLQFKENGKGISYSCEMDLDYEMLYRIEGNKVLVSEYDIPHVDNEEGKIIKYRDDIYVYNGHSLILVGSSMYNIGGLEWTPDIERVIKYERKK